MTCTDEQLREAIVQEYEGERFRRSLTEVTYRPWWRPPGWVGAFAVVVAAAAVAGVVMIGNGWRGNGEPIPPGSTMTTAPTPAAAVGISFEQIESDCRTAGLDALRTAPDISEDRRHVLPSKYVPDWDTSSSGWTDPRGLVNMWIFADDEVLVQCVRFGQDVFDVSVVNVSGGRAPWLHANELPFMTGNDSSGRSYIAGWLPADTEYYYFSVRHDVALDIRGDSERFYGLIDPNAAFPYVVLLPEDVVGEVTITAYTPDQIIRRRASQPATSTAR